MAADSRKLENLVNLGLGSIKSGSSADLQNISMKILELDSKSWAGWYIRGIAEAKNADCLSMYGAWEKAAEYISKEKYQEIRDDLIYYAALASIGYGVEDPKNGASMGFLAAIVDKEPDDSTRFAISIIDMMCEMKIFITDDTACNTICNGCNLAYAALCIYEDISCYLGCYDSLATLYRVVSRTKGICGDTLELCYSLIAPHQMLADELHKDKHPDEDFDRAANYWLNHDTGEYVRYFDEAEEISTVIDSYQ